MQFVTRAYDVRAVRPDLDTQPHLVGQLVELRPLNAGDRQALQAAASDPLIWEQHPADRHLPDVFDSFFAEHLASGSSLLVLDRATGETIGVSRYDRYSLERSEVEIGWTFLIRSRWGGAFNSELKQLMLDHAFTSVERVRFHVAPDNIRSQRAVTKLGALPDGARPDGHLIFVLEREHWRM